MGGVFRPTRFNKTRQTRQKGKQTSREPKEDMKKTHLQKTHNNISILHTTTTREKKSKKNTRKTWNRQSNIMTTQR